MLKMDMLEPAAGNKKSDGMTGKDVGPGEFTTAP